MYQCQITMSKTVCESIILYVKSVQLPTEKVQLNSVSCTRSHMPHPRVIILQLKKKTKKTHMPQLKDFWLHNLPLTTRIPQPAHSNKNGRSHAPQVTPAQPNKYYKEKQV